jgi:hypothetical protein
MAAPADTLGGPSARSARRADDQNCRVGALGRVGVFRVADPFVAAEAIADRVAEQSVQRPIHLRANADVHARTGLVVEVDGRTTRPERVVQKESSAPGRTRSARQHSGNEPHLWASTVSSAAAARIETSTEADCPCSRSSDRRQSTSDVSCQSGRFRRPTWRSRPGSAHRACS